MSYFRDKNTVSGYTKAEMRFLSYLQEFRIPYNTQVHIELPLQPEEERTRHVVPDFTIGSKIVVYIDGAVHDKQKVRIKDEENDKILHDQMGMTVLRFRNFNVLDKTQESKDTIMLTVWETIFEVGGSCTVL